MLALEGAHLLLHVLRGALLLRELLAELRDLDVALADELFDAGDALVSELGLALELVNAVLLFGNRVLELLDMVALFGQVLLELYARSAYEKLL